MSTIAIATAKATSVSKPNALWHHVEEAVLLVAVHGLSEGPRLVGQQANRQLWEEAALVPAPGGRLAGSLGPLLLRPLHPLEVSLGHHCREERRGRGTEQEQEQEQHT